MEGIVGNQTSPGEAVKLPGFGRSIKELPPVTDSDGHRLRFPHAIADNCDSTGIMVREQRMLEFMNKITDKPEWQKKIFDEEIVSNWRAEACVRKEELNDDYLSSAMFNYCLEELRDKADFYQKTGMISVLDSEVAVVKSDAIVPKTLADSLRSLASVLENVPEQDKDWHPGSGEKVLDLLHPSLFPLVYGLSRVLPTGTVPLENCAGYIGKGDPVDLRLDEDEQYHTKPDTLDMEDRCLMAWGNFQWLPSDIHFTETGGPRIDSYVNNLHPLVHPGLYELLEKFVAHSIPLWNECLSWSEGRFRLSVVNHGSHDDFEVADGVMYHPTEDDWDEVGEQPGDGHGDRLRPLTLEEARKLNISSANGFVDWFHEHKILIQKEPVEFCPRSHWEAQPEHRPVDLQEDFRDSGLQIIFKLANIHLTPEKPEYEGGSWHIEGALNEHICATSLYYYDEENITESHLAFRQSLDRENLSLRHEQYEYQSLELYYGIKNDESAIQRLGSVLTRPGRLLAFPNVLQHQVQPFRLADPKKPGHRKILAMFLVDPHLRVLSTANVPPQRKDWWAGEVRKVYPFTALPLELFNMVIWFVEGFPMSWEDALKARSDLMDERGALVDEANDVMEEAEFSFCEH